ncbi:hypothetical protein CPB83DRAFT_883678 [Crepidotus variabilis]|uniref:G domain-containing protein n=1 Tax=Crepidotus variabilis TaxID=179855 RepID=A0A9P6JQ41_9AGAR|nr:hypothetical protein CPB83DRAFT_883678 [Crepidotus variabilis]
MLETALILVVGLTGSGRTTFINEASGSDLKVGGTLKPCTAKVTAAKPFELSDRRVILIDTPGLSSDTLTKISTDVKKLCVSQKQNLAGIIYLHRILAKHIDPTSTLNAQMLKLELNQTPIVIATTFWSKPGQKLSPTPDDIFGEGSNVNASVEKYEDSQESAHKIVSGIMRRSPPAETEIHGSSWCCH